MEMGFYMTDFWCFHMIMLGNMKRIFQCIVHHQNCGGFKNCSTFKGKSISIILTVEIL